MVLINIFISSSFFLKLWADDNDDDDDDDDDYDDDDNDDDHDDDDDLDQRCDMGFYFRG